jgi:putative oxidoreductase
MTNLDARLARYSSPALSVFRVIFGLLYAVHGASKLFAWPVGPKVPVGTWPFWWAGLIELVLGLLITVGLATRIAAFVASGEMAVAYFWQHFPKSFWPIENGGEPAVLFCFGFLLLAGLGAGTFSVDARRRPGAGRSVATRRRFGLRR